MNPFDVRTSKNIALAAGLTAALAPFNLPSGYCGDPGQSLKAGASRHTGRCGDTDGREQHAGAATRRHAA
jgi:hypothetical protein